MLVNFTGLSQKPLKIFPMLLTNWQKKPRRKEEEDPTEKRIWCATRGPWGLSHALVR